MSYFGGVSGFSAQPGLLLWWWACPCPMWLIDFSSFMPLILQDGLHKGCILLFWHEKTSPGRGKIPVDIPICSWAHNGNEFVCFTWRRIDWSVQIVITPPNGFSQGTRLCGRWEDKTYLTIIMDYFPRTRPARSIIFQYVLVMQRTGITLMPRADFGGIRCVMVHYMHTQRSRQWWRRRTQNTVM